jgi:hypothetical protein
VGAAASFAVADALGVHAAEFANATFGERVVKGTIAGFAGGTAAWLARGGRVTVTQVATDAFGNALGDSLVGSMRNAAEESIKKEKGDLSFSEDMARRRAGNPLLMAMYERNQQAATYGVDEQTDNFARQSQRMNSNGIIYKQLIDTFSSTAATGFTDRGPLNGIQLAANDVRDPSQPMKIIDTGSGEAVLSPVVVEGNRSTLYEEGKGTPISEQTLSDGTIVRTYANGYSQSDPRTGQISFTSADMSGLGATLSNSDYDFVSNRARSLSWNSDTPGLWHDVKVGFDNLFGITPNPIRTASQETELSALQGIVNTRVDAAAHPEKYNSTLLTIDTAAGGPIGAAAVIATQNSDPNTRQNVLTLARAADGTLFAIGSAYSAHEDLSALRYQGTQGTLGLPSNTVEAGRVGVPFTRSANPLSPVLEFDAYGNEIMYRTMSEPQFTHLKAYGELLPTTETSISPSIEYSSKYDGVTVKITVAPGTSAQLQEIGIAANKPAATQFPEMSTQTGPWMDTNARFKVEGGQLTTQLGKGKALEIFNQNIVKVERVR